MGGLDLTGFVWGLSLQKKDLSGSRVLVSIVFRPINIDDVVDFK
jgi:hypothetical protein